MPDKPLTTRQASLISWLGVVSMAIAGIGVGLVLGLFVAVGLALDTDMSATSIFAVLGLVTLFPAIRL